jgi:hypothetical protein
MPANPIVLLKSNYLQISNRHLDEQKKCVNIDISKYNNKFFEKVILLL